MKQGTWTWVLAAAVAVGGAVAAGDLASGESMGRATTKPAATRPAAGGRAARKRGLVKPWSEMTTLTPQQQDQIAKIHEDATDQEKKVREKEQDDITALLTPDQRAELADMDNKAKADRKEKYGSKKKGDPATQPAK